MLTSVLPNGLTVQHVSRQDLQFLYEEIFEERCYLRHGVQLRRGDVVLDIGADARACQRMLIGTMSASPRCTAASSRVLVIY